MVSCGVVWFVLLLLCVFVFVCYVFVRFVCDLLCDVAWCVCAGVLRF